MGCLGIMEKKWKLPHCNWVHIGCFLAENKGTSERSCSVGGEEFEFAGFIGSRGLGHPKP